MKKQSDAEQPNDETQVLYINQPKYKAGARKEFIKIRAEINERMKLAVKKSLKSEFSGKLVP